EQLMENDIRREAKHHLYRRQFDQQYSIQASGGSSSLIYFLSAGYNQNKSYKVGNSQERITFNAQSTFKPIKGMAITFDMGFLQRQGQHNGIGLNNIVSRYPYANLINEDGTPAAIARDYRPSFAAEAVN